MSPLVQYILDHAQRGACQCGKCIDPGPDKKPSGHTSDVYFFTVWAINDPDAQTLKGLIAKHKGEFTEANPLDGREHNYMELGAWIGDQGLALMLMGLGELLGLWQVLEPNRLLPSVDKELKDAAAGMGMVVVMAPHIRPRVAEDLTPEQKRIYDLFPSERLREEYLETLGPIAVG